MEIRLGAMTRVLSCCPFERALEVISEVGFHYTALLGQHGGVRPFDKAEDEKALTEIGKLLSKYNLTALMALGGGFQGLEHLDAMKAKLERARYLGIPNFLLLGPDPYAGELGKMKDPALLEKEHKDYIEGLRQMDAYAAELGINIVIKPHGGITGTGRGLVRTMRELGDSSRVRVWYDPGNVLFYEGVNPDEDFAETAQYTTGICGKDHRGARYGNCFPTPGEGDVDWSRIFETLKKVDFAGPLLLELVGGDSEEEIRCELVKAKNYLIRLAESVGAKVLV